MRDLIRRALATAALCGAVLAAAAIPASAQLSTHETTARLIKISGASSAVTSGMTFGTTGTSSRSGTGNVTGTGSPGSTDRTSTRMPAPGTSMPPGCTTYCQPYVGVPMASGPGLGVALGLLGLIGGGMTAAYLRRRRVAG
jgi:hypothetical protein